MGFHFYLQLGHQEHLKELNLDYETIIKSFLDSEYDVNPINFYDLDALSVTFIVDKCEMTLIHFCVDELRHLPHFYLKNYNSYGVLAHIIPVPQFDGIGSICVNHLDSVSINFERPELAFKESIKRHIKLLSQLIIKPDFNKQELLREFNSNWQTNTAHALKKSPKTLYCSSKDSDFKQLDVYKPLLPDTVMSINASFIASQKDEMDIRISQFFSKDERKKHPNSICYILPLQSINPIIPTNTDGLKLWLLEALNSVSQETTTKINKELYSHRTKEFWLVFNVPTPSGKTWFGVILNRDNKRSFPTTLEKLLPWKIEPILINVFNKSLMMPRSGADYSMDNKKVLLFGCGSVGSELAHKLGASGLGSLAIADPDTFSTSNLYRHTLNRNHIHWPKAVAVAGQLQDKYPWLHVTAHGNTLLDSREPKLLNGYDLIIVAIGSPTHERLFHEYVTKVGINIPIIYTWLEGYGIGGHAVLDIPDKKGCLSCAYVESDTGIRGLASNLNFIEANQNIVKNHAGCGEMFIPYGAISSAQTALIAADLSVNYLNGKLTQSTKVSWIGDSADSVNEELKLTQRYHHFHSPLKKHRLEHPLCNVCNPDDSLVYQSNDGLRLCMPQNLYDELLTFRQVEPNSLESAGLIIGCYKNNGEVWLHSLTTPKNTDERSRCSFKLDAKSHQLEVDEAYENSDQLLGYLGTWHTHPQDIPSPSGVDTRDWQTHKEENLDRPLFFIVVGLKKVSIYSLIEGKAVELSNINNKEVDN